MFHLGGLGLGGLKSASAPNGGYSRVSQEQE